MSAAASATPRHCQMPNPRDARKFHDMGGGGYAQFAVNRAGGAALGAKRRPIEKIERDGDQALDGRGFLFLSNNQPKDGVRNGEGYWGGCKTVAA